LFSILSRQAILEFFEFISICPNQILWEELIDLPPFPDPRHRLPDLVPVRKNPGGCRHGTLTRNQMIACL
jgi:hypothetical protein